MNQNMKEVYFSEYCSNCKHYSESENDGTPCGECLKTPAREYSHKPINFEEDN